MRPAIDAGNLIACTSCAKAKAKCDKQLPTCSRCLYKRLKCEPRPPRRYPETFQFLQQSQAQLHHTQSPNNAPPQSQTISPPPSTSPSPPKQDDPTLDESLRQLFPPDRDASFAPFQWQPTPFSGLDTCPGDLTMETVDGSMHQFNPHLLGDPTLFSADDSAMDYDFSSHHFGLLSSSQTSPDALLSAEQPTIPLPFARTEQARLPEPQAAQSSATSTTEDWPCFRCNPPSEIQINPRTGSEYLRRLEETLNDQSVWGNTGLCPNAPKQDTQLEISSVQGSLRDKLMVVSQGFLSRARDVHRTGAEDASLSKMRSSSGASLTGFFILPPPLVLEVFLRTYALRVEPYVPFFPAASIDLTKLMASVDEKSSILLLLLMIAHGAMGSPLAEARHLATGLIETCRICMFDVMEKNVQMSAHPVMVRCALLYLNAAAWSGNKWHMDLSTAHLRMYISMVRHTRMLDFRQTALANMNTAVDIEAAWTTWQTEETLNRLTYSWVTLDQEINLFHDRQPDFDINECNAPIPSGDDLWNARSAEAWHTLLGEKGQDGQQTPSTPHSLSKLFSLFMSNELSYNVSALSLTELRLLLQPIQALIYHLNKSLVYFFNSGSQRLLQRLLTQLEEVQYLLKQWYSICCRSLESSETPTGCSNMVMFHLISLNAITYFPDIERLARGEVSPPTFRESLWAGKRCAEEAPQIWCHCGQVIRYFRQMPASARPYWWSAAIYRIALCMWATSLSRNAETSNTVFSSANEKIVIDTLPFDHPSITRYLRHQDGTPVLSQSNGSLVSLRSINIIQHCVEVLEEKIPLSQLDEGISARLSAFMQRWSTE
ncbi:hypothetical protein BDV95DRAFT_43193 [Massariosphaeria phaeospora]|uniref:Zn(2)-C6 fungal-type domain-containing protein n=1 Tax=Massariosphaeria phaeospora TaxID=100035 RepID=A0A7C8MA64_9PLEO|nr:hypothetical protein BDV95DRAFT_43193 [Massariosphaeria phaeospora]